MESKFTWFPKLTATVEKVPEELRPVLLWALIQYGTYGLEPDLEWPLDAIFESLREDINHSKQAVKNGGSGGRGRKKSGKTQETAPEKNLPLESEKPPFLNEERGVSEPEKVGFEKCQANTLHSSIDIDVKPNGFPSMPPISPQSIEEADAEFGAAALAEFNRITGQAVQSLAPSVWSSLARIRASGRTIDDVTAVVESKLEEWGSNPKMAQYVRPSTLFGQRFEEYLGAAKAAQERKGKAVNRFAEYD